MAAVASGTTSDSSLSLSNSGAVKLALFCIIVDFLTSIWGLCLAISVYFDYKFNKAVQRLDEAHSGNAVVPIVGPDGRIFHPQYDQNGSMYQYEPEEEEEHYPRQAPPPVLQGRPPIDNISLQNDSSIQQLSPARRQPAPYRPVSTPPQPNPGMPQRLNFNARPAPEVRPRPVQTGQPVAPVQIAAKTQHAPVDPNDQW